MLQRFNQNFVDLVPPLYVDARLQGGTCGYPSAYESYWKQVCESTNVRDDGSTFDPLPSPTPSFDYNAVIWEGLEKVVAEEKSDVDRKDAPVPETEAGAVVADPAFTSSLTCISTTSEASPDLEPSSTFATTLKSTGTEKDTMSAPVNPNAVVDPTRLQQLRANAQA